MYVYIYIYIYNIYIYRYIYIDIDIDIDIDIYYIDKCSYLQNILIVFLSHITKYIPHQL